MEERKDRKPIVSKELFLKVAVPALRKAGVTFKKGNQYSQNQAQYWNLIKLVQSILVAATAAGGTNLSLAGVGTCRFADGGRTPESRCKRFKFKLSSSVQKIFSDNRDLVSAEPSVGDEELFIQKFCEAMAALGYGTDSSEEEIVADNQLL